MTHYSCDRCKRSIELDEEIRYSVKVEVQVALDSSEYESQEDRDHLNELHEILERLDDSEKEEISQFAYQVRRFDLCSGCHREYIQNPLAVEATAKVGFSEN